MLRTFAPLLSLSLALVGCAARVEVVTDPVSAAVPVTSAGTPFYAELAVDIPEEARGALEDIVFEELYATGQIVNPSRATGMNLGLRLSFEGTAEPGGVFAFTELTKPPYFPRSIELVAPQRYGPNTTTPVRIEHEALKQIVTKKRIWLIVSNTITSVALGEPLPQEVQLEDVRVHATVIKSFDGLGGAQELSGL